MGVEIAALLTILAPFGSAIAARVVQQNARLKVARELFRGQRCATCGTTIAEPRVGGHAPALRRTDGITIEWTEFSTEQLADAFTWSRPVCWNCHVAEEFRRRYPGLVTDRPAHSRMANGYC